MKNNNFMSILKPFVLYPVILMLQILDIKREICSLCRKVGGARYEIKDVWRASSQRAL